MIEARRSGLSCSNFPPRAFGNTEGFRVHATLCRSCFELRISDFEFSLRSGCHARALACHPEDFENAGRDFWCGDDAKPRRGGLKPPSFEQTAIENRRSLSSNARMLIFNELQKHVIGRLAQRADLPSGVNANLR